MTTIEKTEEKEIKAFSVIETGGKQYKVSEGSIIKIEILPGEFNKGDSIIFDKVLLTDDMSKTVVGAPFIEGSKVTGELMDIARAKKIVAVRYKAKSNYFKKTGHRQQYFQVRISKLA
jgi:large subunit ribosomal protein L21